VLTREKLVQLFQSTRAFVIDDIFVIVEFKNGRVAVLDLNLLTRAELFREDGQDGIVLRLVLVAEGDFLVDADHVFAQNIQELLPRLL